MARYLIQVPRGALSDESKAKVAAAVTAAHREVAGDDPKEVEIAITEIDAGCFFAGGRLIECDHVFLHGYVADLAALGERKNDLSRRLSDDVSRAAGFDPDSTWATISQA
jgi:phenylpyruvate tautomerase PptA (4-oxalocrotonate tautomerase family)